MTYAERKAEPCGEILEKGVFLSMLELAYADKEARENGQFWSGDLDANIALNRFRHNQCMWCGARVGANHVDCEPGTVNR